VINLEGTMPLFVDRGRTPVHWAGDKYNLPGNAAVNFVETPACLRIALVNNMPDAALEDTESQFFGLLNSASGNNPLHVRLFALPNIARSERAQRHLDNFYASTTTLPGQRFDGVIITGTEPRQPDLRTEPYWEALTDLFSWAEENTVSAVLSCLAAHAGVLHSDGICRKPLGEKRFGVFEHAKADHPMTRGTADSIRIPHSRWNGVLEQDLTSAGYSVLTKSERAGVDLFTKERKKSLFVYFQGHPEYVAETLYKEYRRDVKRYLRGEREDYPLVPENYFDSNTLAILEQFRVCAQAERSENAMTHFPEAKTVASLKHSWLSSSRLIYQNWLKCVTSRKQEAVALSVMAPVGATRSACLRSWHSI
jgi:homoserine O-succinyltransferase/O-acetyltransferase